MKLTATRYYHVNPIAGKLLPGEQVIIHIKMPYPVDILKDNMFLFLKRRTLKQELMTNF